MAYERAWHFAADLNPLVVADSGEGDSHYLWTLKAFITGQIGGATTGLWTCAGSSDGVNAAMDGVDRWGSTYDPSKLVRATSGAHSWIVLESPVQTGGYKARVLFSLLTPYGLTATGAIAHSKYAFTGGSTTADPTTTSPSQIAAYYLNTAAERMQLNAALSARGDFYTWNKLRLVIGAYRFDSCVFPVDLDPSDVYQHVYFRANGQPTLGAVNAGSTGRNFNDTVSYAHTVVSPNAGSSAIDSITGKLMDFPWYIVYGSGTYAHTRGRAADYGVMWASNYQPQDGTVVRDISNNVVYCTVQQMILPFNAAPDMA